MSPSPVRPFVLAAASAAALVLAGCSGSGGPSPEPEAARAPAPATTAAAPSAPAPEPPKQMSQEEMMAAWEAAGTPGDAHAKLQPLVGTWDVQATFWMAPDAPPDTSPATSTNEWILGGRWLAQTYAGTVTGQPFEGRGLTGYDNVLKKYVGTWIDSWSTSLMTSSGSVDATGTKFTLTAINSDPATGGLTEAREEIVIEGPDRHVMTMHSKDPGTGQEYKVMELVFTRAAAKK